MPEFSWPVRVYYEDTDASGVVYHANYLKYFERARTEWVRARGITQDEMRLQHGLAFTVADLEIRFLRAARLDDELVVTTTIAQARRASLTFAQTLARAVGGQVLATVRVRVACVDVRDFKPQPLPAAVSEWAQAAGSTPTKGGATA